MISLDDWYVQVNPIDGTIKVEMPQKDQLENPAKVFFIVTKITKKIICNLLLQCDK